MLNAASPAPAVAWDWAGLRTASLRETARLLPRAEAEEAAQEALERAWRNRHACRTPQAPLPWVLEIARNEARRALARRIRRGDRELVEAPSIEPECDDGALSGATTRVTVAQALEELDQADRRVLGLRYGQDLTQAEVARRLGWPEGTVKVRLHRARRRLRLLLDEEPDASLSA